MNPTLKAPAAASGRGAAFLTGGSLLFASREEKALGRALDDGLVAVEKGLERELTFSDEITDAVSRHLFDAGGKRVRPLLALLTSQWGSGINDRVLIAAQVTELTHLATLYHDDVMDDAVQRRGVAATQTVWGNSVAILAGPSFREGRKLGRVIGPTSDYFASGNLRETGRGPDARNLRPQAWGRAHRSLSSGAFG